MVAMIGTQRPTDAIVANGSGTRGALPGFLERELDEQVGVVQPVGVVEPVSVQLPFTPLGV